MPRPYDHLYGPATPRNRPRQSVPGVLIDQVVGVELRLRNRHQDEVRGARARPRGHVLELPASGELTVPDQILAPLPLTVQLEQPSVTDQVMGNRSGQRRGHCVFAATDLVQEGEGSRASG